MSIWVKKMYEERCKKCNHLLSKHPRPKHLRGFGEWDYYDGHCCVRNCNCRVSCFGQQLTGKGNVRKGSYQNQYTKKENENETI